MTKPRWRHVARPSSAALLIALLVAVGAALAQPAASPVESSARAALPSGAPRVAATVVQPASSNEPSRVGADDSAIRSDLLPPGARVTALPSDEIFPPQLLTIRFDHRRHLTLDVKPRLRCGSCHSGVTRSDRASDRLMPAPASACDGCHGSDHRNLEAVVAGSDGSGACESCHVGAAAGPPVRVSRMRMPAPNLRHSHRKHLDRNIGCGQCHGDVGRFGLATRAQLPRMAGCFVCHAMSGSAQGEARGRCTVCHVTGTNGRLRTAFATGPLQPPDWLHGAGHGPRWAQGHRAAAAANSAMCGACHDDAFCAGCHDGKARPRAVHPGDWLGQHAMAARQDNPRCVSCHQLQSFCADCHRRAGVARDGPTGPRADAGRFHPRASEWSSAPRGATHHAWEAMRNLNACVACHSERDCASCHATKGVRGGQGVSPHPPGFGCATAFSRNPRPCLVCHRQDDAALRGCP